MFHEACIIHDDEFRMDRSQHQTNVLKLLSSSLRVRKNTVRKSISIPKTIERLSIIDTLAVAQIMQKQFQHIEVKAPGRGFAFFPVKTDNDDKDGNGKLTVETEVK
ncbi:hypothetical protein [Candidatus Coxiella mudrowiae]|uniref:hypothetical protein n=1 Tax=Candidatus Coxiella mudrowiae TaxID=2054173 RepID=UPI0012FE8693|nr:hypothetical protein [Candidatus Coxiella mudrowiae]